MRLPALALGLALVHASLATAAPPVPVTQPVTPVTDDAVAAVASQLRCVVCQNLSVADSPSEMARQMREVIRVRLAQGESPREVLAYFEARYGEWVLLSPKLKGFSLIVWVLPFAGLIVGLGTVLLVAGRWTRPAESPADTLTPADRERVQAELERLPD